MSEPRLTATVPKPLISPTEGELLRHYASLVPPGEEIVEVGSWAGTSSVKLCEGCSVGVHITCVDHWIDWQDPPPDQFPWLGADAMRIFLERTDPTKVTALHARSLDVAMMWTKPIGMLFLDADHYFDHIRDDYLAWSPFVAPGGILAMHDVMWDPPAEYWWMEGPTRVVDEFVEPSGQWERLEHADWLWIGRRL